GRGLSLRIGVAQPDGAVEDETAGRRVRIAAEIAQPLELHRLLAVARGERRLETAIGEDLERLRIEIGGEIATGARRRAEEERVVLADLPRHRPRRADPMQ